MNPLLQKSLNHYNYLNAKKKATLEEERYENYMPSIPPYTKPKVEKLSAGVYNFIRNLRP